MTIYFSKETLSFFDNSISSFIPQGVVEVPYEEYKEFIKNPVGKTLSCDENGYPIFIDFIEKEKTNKEKIISLENSITKRRLREAILTEDGSAWLADIEHQIEILRQGL